MHMSVFRACKGTLLVYAINGISWHDFLMFLTLILSCKTQIVLSWSIVARTTNGLTFRHCPFIFDTLSLGFVLHIFIQNSSGKYVEDISTLVVDTTDL